jgi:hypothetical protein
LRDQEFDLLELLKQMRLKDYRMVVKKFSLEELVDPELLKQQKQDPEDLIELAEIELKWLLDLLEILPPEFFDRLHKGLVDKDLTEKLQKLGMLFLEDSKKPKPENGHNN